MLNQDLFTKPISKKDKLYQWLKERHHAKISEIIQYGLDHYSTRADRDARLLAQEGKIRRMDRQNKIRRFGNISEEAWEIVETQQQTLIR